MNSKNVYLVLISDDWQGGYTVYGVYATARLAIAAKRAWLANPSTDDVFFTVCRDNVSIQRFSIH